MGMIYLSCTRIVLLCLVIIERAVIISRWGVFVDGEEHIQAFSHETNVHRLTGQFLSDLILFTSSFNWCIQWHHDQVFRKWLVATQVRIETLQLKAKKNIYVNIVCLWGQEYAFVRICACVRVCLHLKPDLLMLKFESFFCTVHHSLLVN